MGCFPDSLLQPAGLRRTGRPLASPQGWGEATGPGVLPQATRKLALSSAGTYVLRAAAGGPATWHTVGRKLEAGGRAVAETTGGHTE